MDGEEAPHLICSPLKLDALPAHAFRLLMYCEGPQNYQDHVEVHLKYPMLELYQDSRTI